MLAFQLIKVLIFMQVVVPYFFLILFLLYIVPGTLLCNYVHSVFIFDIFLKVGSATTCDHHEKVDHDKVPDDTDVITQIRHLCFLIQFSEEVNGIRKTQTEKKCK